VRVFNRGVLPSINRMMSGGGRVPSNDLDLLEAPYKSLLPLCERCVNDAGFHSGMAGAARCELIERATNEAFGRGAYPTEWQPRSDGTLSCSAFTPDV